MLQAMIDLLRQRFIIMLRVRQTSCHAVADSIGVNRQTLRNWINQDRGQLSVASLRAVEAWVELQEDMEAPTEKAAIHA